MRTHLNSGLDIETASQMMTVIESSGGISGVRVTVSGPQPAAKSTPVKWDGVSFINNVAYTKEGLHVWRAYGIGSGKFVPWSNFRQQVGSLPQLNKQKRSSSAEVSFQTAKARSKPKQKPVLEEAPQNRNNSDDDESCNGEGSDLFCCPVLCTILIARKTSGLWLTQVCPGTGNTVQQGNYHVRHQTGVWPGVLPEIVG